MRSRIQQLTLLMLIVAAAPAYAEVYKWVDKNGVTNYSDNPLSNVDATKKLEIVPERISVYTPEKSIKRALEAGPQRSDRIAYNGADLAERQLEAQALQAAYDQCVAQRRVDCLGDGYQYGGYFPYAPLVVIPVHRRHPRFVSAVTVSRATAGRSFNGTVMGARMATFRSFPAARMSRSLMSK